MKGPDDAAAHARQNHGNRDEPRAPYLTAPVGSDWRGPVDWTGVARPREQPYCGGTRHRAKQRHALRAEPRRKAEGVQIELDAERGGASAPSHSASYPPTGAPSARCRVSPADRLRRPRRHAASDPRRAGRKGPRQCEWQQHALERLLAKEARSRPGAELQALGSRPRKLGCPPSDTSSSERLGPPRTRASITGDDRGPVRAPGASVPPSAGHASHRGDARAGHPSYRPGAPPASLRAQEPRAA